MDSVSGYVRTDLFGMFQLGLHRSHQMQNLACRSFLIDDDDDDDEWKEKMQLDVHIPEGVCRSGCE